jgi:hypothetical protein
LLLHELCVLQLTYRAEFRHRHFLGCTIVWVYIDKKKKKNGKNIPRTRLITAPIAAAIVDIAASTAAIATTMYTHAHTDRFIHIIFYNVDCRVVTYDDDNDDSRYLIARQTTWIGFPPRRADMEFAKKPVVSYI